MSKLKPKVINGVAPITLADCVKMGDGTSSTVKDEILSIKSSIENGGNSEGSNSDSHIIDKIQSISSKFKNYKGSFDYSLYASNKANSVEGDWWIWNGDSIMDFDFSVAYPGDVIYRDSNNLFKTHHIPKETAITPRSKYDVCIVGGGAGGIGTAYALKNSGLKVCLVERLDTLGGTHCNAGVGMLIATPMCDWYKTIVKDAYDVGKMEFFNFSSAGNVGRKVGDGTVFEKMWRGALYTDDKNVRNGYRGNHIKINDAWFSQKYFDDLSPTIDIFLNTELEETKSVNGNVKYIKTKNIINGTEFTICADYFADCSGDGVLFTKDTNLTKNTDYYIGSDPKSRFNESVYASGWLGDDYMINTVEPVYFQTFARYIGGYVSLQNYPNSKNYKSHEGVFEKANYQYKFPGSNSNVTTVSNSNGTKMSLYDFIDLNNDYNMSDGYARAENVFNIGGYTAGNRFGGIRKMLAIREKYRIAAEKTVDQTYLTKQITSSNYREEKTIALSTWWVDFHNEPTLNATNCPSNIANGVPFDSMIPKCYKNVLVACRAYGASHIGLSSQRLVKTMADMGYAAGTSFKQLLASTSRNDVRTINVESVQDNMGIGGVIQELETHFYGNAVDFTE